MNLNTLSAVLKRHHSKKLLQPFLLSEKLLAEILSFIRRNTITIPAGSSPVAAIKGCCLSCCKAHALSIAKKHELSEEARVYLDSLFKEKCGHDGFYLDKDTLHRC